MKKTLLTLAVFAALVACNSGGDKKEGENKGDEKKDAGTVTDITKDPNYQKGLSLVGASDCFTCHKPDGVLTGPGYKQVAEKYSGASEEKIAELAQTIIKGVPAGKGTWGEAQMTPHPNVSEDDAKAMVRYVLLLK